MNVQDLLKNPQLFAVKRKGKILYGEGLSIEPFIIKQMYLANTEGIFGCGNPDCDCIDKAWADHADGATIVPVTIIETAPEGRGR